MIVYIICFYSSLSTIILYYSILYHKFITIPFITIREIVYDFFRYFQLLNLFYLQIFLYDHKEIYFFQLKKKKGGV